MIDDATSTSGISDPVESLSLYRHDSDRDERYVAMYDEQARDYDARSFASRGGDFSKRYKNSLILEMLRKYGSSSDTESVVVLDCPAGTGRMTHSLASEFECNEIIACDISPNMLRMNEQALPGTTGNVSFHVANMKSLPLESASVSVACVTSFLYLIPREEYRDYLADVFRVIRPGGLVLVEASNVLPAYNPLNLMRVLKERFVERRSVKSYVSPLEFGHLFAPFDVLGYRGSEFPLLSKRYSVYARMSRFLGGTPLLKSFSGKFTVALQKPVTQGKTSS